FTAAVADADRVLGSAVFDQHPIAAIAYRLHPRHVQANVVARNQVVGSVIVGDMHTQFRVAGNNVVLNRVVGGTIRDFDPNPIAGRGDAVGLHAQEIVLNHIVRAVIDRDSGIGRVDDSQGFDFAVVGVEHQSAAVHHNDGLSPVTRLSATI